MPARLALTLRWLTVGVTITIALLIGIGVVFSDNPGKLFGEGRPGTLLTVLALLAAAFLCVQVAYRLRSTPHAPVWIVMGMLFTLTAMDDMFKLHEKADQTVIAALGLDPEGPADRIDDILVLLYAVPAGCLVALGWRQLLRLRWCVRLFALAASFFGIMAAIDMADLHHTTEESAKLVASALIFAAVVAAKQDPLMQRLIAANTRRLSAAGEPTNPR